MFSAGSSVIVLVSNASHDPKARIDLLVVGIIELWPSIDCNYSIYTINIFRVSFCYEVVTKLD